MTEEVNKGGRPHHKPTEEGKKIARTLSAYGVPHADIGREIGVNQDTLRKYYRDDLDKGMADANARVAEFLFKQASGAALKDGATQADCGRAAMFWSKTRMGWREVAETRHANPDGTALQFNTIYEAKKD